MADSPLAQVRIVLVEPAGPLNIGAISRVLKNMGLRQLILVNPLCDPLGTEARQMAVHAVDLLQQARQVQTLPQALEGCERIMATTMREQVGEVVTELPRTGLPWLLGHPAALIFGREDRGLTNTELNYAQRLIRIPTDPIYPSLNLAQAVAVCSYELYQQASQALVEPIAPGGGELARFENLEAYYQQLETVLLKIGYLYSHTAVSRMAKFRRLFNRSQPTEAEVALLRGILSQVEWALTAKPALDSSPDSRETST